MVIAVNTTWLFSLWHLLSNHVNLASAKLNMLSYRSQLHKIAWREITHLPLRCLLCLSPANHKPRHISFLDHIYWWKGLPSPSWKNQFLLICQGNNLGSIPYHTMLRTVIFPICCPRKKNSFLTKITKLAQNQYVGISPRAV